MIDGQGMCASGDFAVFGDGGITLLFLIGGIDDDGWDGVVFLARNEQEGSALRILCVDAVLRPRVEVGTCGLKEWCAGGRDRERFV